VGIPSPSNSSFHISAIIRLFASLTFTHISSFYLTPCIHLSPEGGLFLRGSASL
jgi:hypothetical protein